MKFEQQSQIISSQSQCNKVKSKKCVGFWAKEMRKMPHCFPLLLVIYPFIHLLKKYLLCACYVPSTEWSVRSKTNNKWSLSPIKLSGKKVYETNIHVCLKEYNSKIHFDFELLNCTIYWLERLYPQNTLHIETFKILPNFIIMNFLVSGH